MTKLFFYCCQVYQRSLDSGGVDGADGSTELLKADVQTAIDVAVTAATAQLTTYSALVFHGIQSSFRLL